MVTKGGTIIVVAKQGKVEILTSSAGRPGPVQLTPDEAKQLADLIRGEGIVAEQERTVEHA